jgi:ornithine decarboxylase
LGFKLKILDIGGGFNAETYNGQLFPQIASVINRTLEKYFPKSMGIYIIAEPGTYFANGAFTLSAQVFGKRIRKSEDEPNTTHDIYI